MINLLFRCNVSAPIQVGFIRRKDIIYRLMMPLAVMLLVLFMVTPAMAGTHSLGTPVDSSSDVSVPVTDHLMVTIPSSAGQGGNDATSATVSISGTVVLADVAEIAVFYQGVEAGRLAITGLSNQVIDLPGNTKGNQDWTFFISLNTSAAGKTFGLTVVSIAGTNNANLPYSTALRNATGTTAPEMNIYYQSTPSGDVADGDTTPTAVEGNEFGSSPVTVSVDHTFTIQNTGNVDLILTDASPYVIVTGADFQLIAPNPTTPVSSGGGTTTFTVRFTPSSTGLKTGTVSIANDDSDENPYNFNIQGTGAAPEMNVYYLSTPAGDVADGDTTPTAVEGNEFGSGDVSTNVDRTFTIQNTGTADLSVGTVTVTGTDFSLLTPPSSPVASGGGTTTFTVRFTPGSEGLKTGTVSIANDDSDENPYNFDIQGTGTAAVTPPTVVNPSVDLVEDTTATLGGEVTVINGTNITERGIYWSTTQGFTPPGQGTKVSTTGTWGTGTFTENVPVTSGALIYFKAFAINDTGGEGYTGEASFQAEPTQVPALSVGFENIGPKGMRITWNAGGGDGAIVVVKEGSAVDVGVNDPIDGTSHTFNSYFPSATDLGGGNYVVYRGPATQVDITGLTAVMTYYVAVYEYAGSGPGTSGINYQQHSPATGNQATTAAPQGHNNAHNITNCDQCHAMHTGTSGIVPHDAAQETVCKTCHNSTQMAGFPNLWDVGMHEVTKGGPRTVDCGSCHEVHNGYDFNTVDTHTDGVTAENLSRIRQDTSKYVTGALEPALFQTDPGHFAFAEADASQSGSPWNGICQSCHTNASLKFHTNGSQASEPNPHNHNKVGPPTPEPDCMVCHTHSGGFSAAGGSCNECHNSVKNAGGPNERRIIWNAAGDAGDFVTTSHHASDGTTTQVATENDCAVCHVEPGANHMDGVVDLKNPDTGATFTITDLQENPGEAQTIQDNLCLKCHDLGGATSTYNSTDGGSVTLPFSNNTKAVPDVFSQFDTANDAFHPVRGTTGSTGSTSIGITASTMQAPWVANIGTQTMTCFDCHDNNAHGSDYQKMLPVEDPASPGTYYGIDFNWYETFSGDMSGATTPTPGNSPPASLDTHEERIEAFCTKCHEPSVYVTGADGFSVWEKHGANQSQHGAAGGNQLGCLGCHGGTVDQNGGVVADNGAWNGNIHGVVWDWETDGGLTFGSKNWPGTPPADSVANNFMLGGWLSGWSAAGECGGGNCNHAGSADRGGGQSYTPAID
jgi:hypothetical protein